MLQWDQAERDFNTLTMIYKKTKALLMKTYNCMKKCNCEGQETQTSCLLEQLNYGAQSLTLRFWDSTLLAPLGIFDFSTTKNFSADLTRETTGKTDSTQRNLSELRQTTQFKVSDASPNLQNLKRPLSLPQQAILQLLP